MSEHAATPSAGDAGFEVNLVHTELEFQAGDFDGVAGFVGDDVPADIATAAIDFDLGLFLADEQVFLEAGQGAVGAEFFAAVGGFGGGGGCQGKRDCGVLVKPPLPEGRIDWPLPGLPSCARVLVVPYRRWLPGQHAQVHQRPALRRCGLGAVVPKSA